MIHHAFAKVSKNSQTSKETVTILIRASSFFSVRAELPLFYHKTQYDARTSDIDSMVFLLTGMSNQAFRAKWQIHTADLLLRYTKMGVAEVAQRSGMGTRTIHNS